MRTWGLACIFALALPAAAEVAVTTSGAILEGVFRVEEARHVALFGEEELPLYTLLLVETDEGGLIWAPDIGARIRGYRHLAARAIRPALPDLIVEAVRARDATSARRIYDWAIRVGLEAKDERVLGKRLADLERKSLKPQEEKRTAVLEQERLLRRRLPDLLVARLLREKEGSLDALRMLRVALDESAGHDGALAALAARAPAGEGRAWLEWHLDCEVRGLRRYPIDSSIVGSARHYWHPDAVGVGNDEFVILTPSADAVLLKDALLRTWLTIERLKLLFRTAEPMLRPQGPIKIHLFENEKHFQTEIAYEVVAEVPPFWQWQHGKFFARDDLTRLLAPAAPKDRPSFERALIHEVARHWLWSKCPRYATSELMRAPDIAGEWVEAGLLSLFLDATYDLEEGVVRFQEADTASLALLREQAPKQGPKQEGIYPWGAFFLMDSDDVAELWKRDWYDGQPQPSALYAAQAAAVAHYLFWANGGVLRESLIDYYAHQKVGRQARLDPAGAFGKPADILGAQVLAHAQAMRAQ